VGANTSDKSSGRSRRLGHPALLFLFLHADQLADKVVVGLAAVPLMKDLGLTPEQFGDIGSAFFFLFAISAILVGLITNRRSGQAHSPGSWRSSGRSCSSDAGTVSLETLIACRIVWAQAKAGRPCRHPRVYKWFPDRSGLPTAIIAQGSAFGVIIAVPVLNRIIENYSWHWRSARWHRRIGMVGPLAHFGREGTLVDAPDQRQRQQRAHPYRYLLTCPASSPPARGLCGYGAWRSASRGSPRIS